MLSFDNKIAKIPFIVPRVITGLRIGAKNSAENILEI